MANVIYRPSWLDEAQHVFGIVDDFDSQRTDLKWTDQVADGGTVTDSDAVGGRISLGGSGNTDNDELYVASTKEIFLVAAGKPLYAEARIQYTEANTDDANVIFGFMSAAAAQADLIVDDGAGPRASGQYCLIEKRDGETQWRGSVRNGSTASTTLSTTTAGGASFQTLGVEVIDLDGTNVKVVFTVDGVRLRDSDGDEIDHTMAIASSTEMNLVVGFKHGGANAETLVVDYLGGWQHR